jgi:hypothetical protein
VAAERDDVTVIHVPVLAVERDGFVVERLDEEVERLLVARTGGLVERQAGGRGDPAVAAADAELVAAAGEQRELVDHRREHERVVVREDVQHRPELDAPGARSRHPEEAERVRRGRELREEHVLDRGVCVVAEAIGVLDLLQHLSVELRVGLSGPALQLAVEAELHVRNLRAAVAESKRLPRHSHLRPPTLGWGKQ